VANHLFVYLFDRFGFRRMTIIAASFASLSTFVYGIASGVCLWVVARMVWGFCFSALRTSAMSYSLQMSHKPFSLGLSKGVQELGPILALLVGPLLVQWTNISITFFIFAIASSSAILISIHLPEIKGDTVKNSFSLNVNPSTYDVLAFLTSFFVQGVLVVVTAKLFMHLGLSTVALTAMAGLYLAYRRISTVFIAPVGGVIADRLGFEKVYVTSLFMIIAGLFCIALGYFRTGIIMAFTFYSITSALGPGAAVNGSTNQLKSLAVNSTWTDIGAAAGSLVGGAFLVFDHYAPVFFLSASTLLVVVLFHIKAAKNKNSK
jgi:MFS transporter, DHA1 family, multidrug resistance protein